MFLGEKKRIAIFVGNYGSGKTELSIDYAVKNARKNPTILIDLDIVNPYFRSGEKKELLEGYGVELITPLFANTAVDIPSLPSDIQKAILKKASNIIFDVGGDDSGATALGRYFPLFESVAQDIQTIFVINTLRPLTHEKNSIIDLIQRVENRSRLEINGLINNTNVADETTFDLILDGQNIVKQVSEELNIPIMATTVDKRLFTKLPNEEKQKFWCIERRMALEW